MDAISGSHITEHSIKVGRWDIASKQLAGDLPEAGESGGEVNPPAERSLGSAAVESHRAEPAACQHIPVLTLPPADADSTAVTVRLADVTLWKLLLAWDLFAGIRSAHLIV